LFSFNLTKKWVVLLITGKTLQVLLPILEALLASFVISELAGIVLSQDPELTEELLFFTVSAGVVAVLISINNSILNDYVYLRANYEIELRLFTLYLSSLASIDMQYHEDSGFKTFNSKVFEAVSYRFFQTANLQSSLFANTAGFLLSFGILLSINIWLLLFLLIPITLNFVVDVVSGKQIYNIRDFEGEEKKEASHALSGLGSKDIIQESKIYGFGGYIAGKYNDAHKKFIDSVSKKIRNKTVLSVLIGVLNGAINLFIQIWLIVQAVEQKISIQGYTFYLQNLQLVSRNFYDLQYSLARMIQNSHYIKDLRYLLEMSPEIHSSFKPVPVEDSPPTIEFKNVTFKYPGSEELILKNLSFKINSGEKLALVGENGAGKSTIIKLLARFYDPSFGDILVNGTNIKDIDLKSYYKLWGVLFQHFAKYWFTAWENIGIGNLDEMGSIDLVKESAKKTGASEFIEKLPDKYSNMLSTDFKNGKDLSGGEWQKLGISRGIFANPKLVILDEPTSNLDALSEAGVFKEIEKLSKGATMIIVSHRFSTVKNADRILVLENGKITEQGNHEDLMKNKKLYHKMFTSQAKGYK
jgi:ATP-binding cassette, subfamily B, bacterial